MNRIIGFQQDMLGGPEVAVWSAGRAPLARRKDPSTSHAAATSARALAERHRALILDCLQKHGPLGKDGIACRTKLTGVAVARRTVELQRDGKIDLTGRHVMSTSGRLEREWKALP